MSKPNTLIVENAVETFEVELVKVAGVDQERLDAALADHAQAVKDREAFFKELNGLRDRTAELDAAIFDIEAMLSENPGADLDIEGIKVFADEQTRLQNQITALVKVRTHTEKQIKAADSRFLDLVIQDSKKNIWNILYDGLLSAIDKESIEKLFIAGAMISKSDRQVVLDLNLSNDTRLFESLVKQFSLPA